MPEQERAPELKKVPEAAPEVPKETTEAAPEVEGEADVKVLDEERQKREMEDQLQKFEKLMTTHPELQSEASVRALHTLQVPETGISPEEVFEKINVLKDWHEESKSKLETMTEDKSKYASNECAVLDQFLANATEPTLAQLEEKLKEVSGGLSYEDMVKIQETKQAVGMPVGEAIARPASEVPAIKSPGLWGKIKDGLGFTRRAEEKLVKKAEELEKPKKKGLFAKITAGETTPEEEELMEMEAETPGVELREKGKWARKAKKIEEKELQAEAAVALKEVVRTPEELEKHYVGEEKDKGKKAA